MTWNGNGVFNPPGGPEFPAIANDLIRSSYYNSVIQSLCDAFLNTLPRDGQAPMTGDIDGNNLYRVKNLPAAVANGQSVRYQEFIALQTTVNGLASSVEPFIYLNAGLV
jgi:hypothetical protein